MVMLAGNISLRKGRGWAASGDGEIFAKVKAKALFC
jgi:hypothetical protein